MTRHVIFASALVLATGGAFAAQSEWQAGPDSPQQVSAQESRDFPAPVDDQMIRQLQQALSEQGQDLQTDGIWGPETHQALRQYQQEQGLEPSGQIDSETLASLNLENQQSAAMEQGQPEQDQQASVQEDQQQAGVSERMQDEMSAAFGEGEPAEYASGAPDGPLEDPDSLRATAPDNMEQNVRQSMERAETELEEGQRELEQQG
ncbi:peptidoglycan-binding domain-containing protein [Alkalilimnicola sp. S0819]|uniref:peptidoglycan-binding domain-containing protein n=1 Tax=Alkalilimnicola sp. S0819 TaxID=2613922 RepID=UPI001869E776|nr:peptidoglycan-binding domain-containing protein [Alkalilimnicola sp. S0819]